MSRTTRQQKIEVIRSETREQANTRQRVADILTDINEATIDDIVAGDNITIDKTDPSKPLIKSSASPFTFATQPEMESQTPPDTENNKAVSLFGLWKWNKNLKYLYLTNSVANAIPNKDWSDGINRWYTNKDGINKRYALVDSSPSIDKIALLTPSGTLKPITSVPINPLIKIYGESLEGVISYNDTVQAKKVDTSNTEPTILQLIEKGVDRVDYPNLGRIYFNYGTKWGYITLTEVMV